MNSNYQYVASIFLKFGEVKVEYFVYKKVFGFPPFYFITFLWSFVYSSQKQKVRCRTSIKISRAVNWMRKNTNTILWKSSFVNIWRLNRFPLKFLWEVVARKSKECSPGSNCFLWTVLPESANYFLMKPVMNWYVNDKPCISKQKLSYLKRMTLLAFLGWSKKAISTTRATQPRPLTN